MAEENENQEPKEGEEEQSMDEILGSIREILSDEDQENQSEAVASANNTEEEQVDESDATQSSEPEESSSEDAELADPESTSDTAVQDVEATSDSESDMADQIEANEAEDATDNESSDGGSESEDNSDTEEPNEFLELTKDMIAPPPPDFDAGSPIVSGATQTASADPLQELAKALLNRRDIAIGNRDMTLEGLIREILRPLLKEWLDDNLPYLIERLVKKEIDHMVNKAERLDL
jgi:cell pole-organizing protein PopZ